MSINAKELARRIILDHAQDVEFLSISEMTEDDADEERLTPDQHDQLCRKIDKLISKATVTVSWDDDEQADSEASA